MLNTLIPVVAILLGLPAVGAGLGLLWLRHERHAPRGT